MRLSRRIASHLYKQTKKSSVLNILGRQAGRQPRGQTPDFSHHSNSCAIPNHRVEQVFVAMSWVRDTKLTWTQRLAVKVVRTGPMPRHIAFIMDGNRRFSRKAQLESVGAGHACGFDKLAEALQWCLELGIEEVTVYAFSIENFKRSRSEVDTLLELAREKFARLMEEKDQLHERGICIRMVGNWSLLPLDLQKSMAAATLLTYGNTRAVLNVAFAYTSRDEMTESVVAVVDGVQRGELEPCDISDELLRRCMYTGASRDPDLLVRTSGESRLSDFLLWQVSVVSRRKFGADQKFDFFFFYLFEFLPAGLRISHLFHTNAVA